MTFSWQLHRHRGRRGPATGDRGFTVVELLTVVMLAGTLGRVAAPDFHELFVQARAQEVVADVQILQLAVVTYQDDHGSWPEDTYAGVVPDGLESYLPEGFDMRGAGYRLDWDNWLLPDGLPENPDIGGLLAFSVVTEDRALGLATRDLLSAAMPAYVLDDRYTFVFAHN